MGKTRRMRTAAGLTLGLLLTAALPRPAAADDIDIYLQPSATASDRPLVVVNLDLNLDAGEIVCSNVLADPATLPDEPLCETLQRTAVVPVLEQALDLRIGSLLGDFLGSGDGDSGLLNLVDSLAGMTLSGLADELRAVTGDSGSGDDVPLEQLDVARLVLYRLIHQLVGTDLIIVANNANTCDAADYTTPRHNTKDCSNGAFIFLGATELLEDSIDATVDDVLARMNQAPVNLDNPDADFTPPFQGKEMYYELVRYLTDGRIYNSRLNADNGLPLSQDPDIYPGQSGVDYISPLETSYCDEIHVINVMFTDSQLDDDSDADILADARFAGANADGGEFTWANMVSFLENQGITFDGRHFTFKNYYLLNGPGPGGADALLSNLVGTTMNLPVALNPLSVHYADHDTFAPVLSESTSFGGPQVLYNRRQQGEAADALFTGLFRPDPDRSPAWRGNVKKLKLDDTAGAAAIVDALGQPAIGPDGKIRDRGLTFWTDAAELPTDGDVILGRDGKTVDRGGAGMFLLPPYTPASPANPAGTGSGTGGPRIFYQTAPAGAADLPIGELELDTNTVDEAGPALESSNDLEAAEILAWARGYETDINALGDQAYGGFLGYLNSLVSGISDEIEATLENLLSDLFCNPLFNLLGAIVGYDCTIPGPVEPPERDWQMGDVLHSHPLAIDYGSTTNDTASDIRVFAGTNTGFLHQFRDGADGTGTFPGQEVWRFSPRRLLRNYKLWKESTPTAASRPYGVDGAPVAYIHDDDGVIDAADGDKVHVYFGLRRGGKAYYGLDVTRPDAPPGGLWRIEKTATAGSAFEELGLTFSTPRTGRIVRATGDGGNEIRPVLVFGGGYDGGYDSGGNPLGKDAASGSEYNASKSATSEENKAVVGDDDDEGNALYVVDAETGALIWKARRGGSAGTTTGAGADIWTHPDLQDSIPSAPTALDTDGDGLLDRIYVGDTGGRVWRADIGDPDPGNWRMAPIANLGRHGVGSEVTVADDRRFFHAPDVVRVNVDGGGFNAVIVASGNRADPLNRHTQNYLYVLKDGPVLDVDATPIRNGDLASFGSNCGGGGCTSLLDADFTARGWRIALAAGGEKALATPTTVSAAILFTTYIPPDATASVCEPQEGTGRLYAIDLRTGEPALADFATDGESTGLAAARGTPLAAAGIPAQTHYLRQGLFLGSDFGLTELDHRRIWRTYWRERSGGS